tara:strand:+ start:3946 stop:6168 length:2223 start_codon:yes stop_codon:yes gene_type:complete
MGATSKQLIELSKNAGLLDEALVGGKAANLSKLIMLGFNVPNGWVLTANAYQDFIKCNRLDKVIAYETNRKPLSEMRWEELWDAALRIRSAFSLSDLPDAIGHQLEVKMTALSSDVKFAVRSSAIGEDSAGHSFAGVHESILNVTGIDELVEAIKLVWSSLWSDMAMLYMSELKLNASQSAMPIVIQPMQIESVSGVAFGIDPVDPNNSCAVIEAVPGECQLLVDGLVEPDRWYVERQSGRIVSWGPGQQGLTHQKNSFPLLNESDIKKIYETLRKVEVEFNFMPDIEWTGQQSHYTILQARPITAINQEPQDIRASYKRLKLNFDQLSKLKNKVVNILIPELEQQGNDFANENIEQLDNAAFAKSLFERLNSLQHWQLIYQNDFIPFAHGVRYLGSYYNDIVKPSDPYEFVGILKGQSMLASERNQSLQAFAMELSSDNILQQEYQSYLQNLQQYMNGELKPSQNLENIIAKIDTFIKSSMDFVFEGVRLTEKPEPIYQQILFLATHLGQDKAHKEEQSDIFYEQKLLNSVPPTDKHLASTIIEFGKVSWRLRDDDNLLLSRIESQLLRSLKVALARLNITQDLIVDSDMAKQIVPDVILALEGKKTLSTIPQSSMEVSSSMDDVRIRQLTGQPAARGLKSGKVCLVVSAKDLGNFRAGDILVCKAIQPMMTHLIPLAGAIIEERGGMLIHGAIIARELQIPCVNGVKNATYLLKNSDWITVDGDLGIITLGGTGFEFE